MSKPFQTLLASVVGSSNDIHPRFFTKVVEILGKCRRSSSLQDCTSFTRLLGIPVPRTLARASLFPHNTLKLQRAVAAVEVLCCEGISSG